MEAVSRAWVVAASLLVAGCRDEPRAPTPAAKVSARTPAVGRHTEGGYVGSATCVPCHEGTHASWHRSYHRTMTTRPSAQTVLGRFDGVPLDRKGLYRAFERDDVYLVSQPGDGDTSRESPVELITGSHHMQVYWVRGAGGSLEAFAFAFLLPEQRWVPNEWTLLRPPAEHDALAGEKVDAVYTWNRVCVKCHAVDGVPGFDEATATVSSTVAELGIACEACHGPGAVHAEHWRDRPAPQEDGLRDDPTMLDPRELGAAKASEVCGQCHSISLFHDDAAWVARGRDAPPPAPMSAWGRVVRHPLREHGPWTDALLDTDPDFFAQRYWSDGEVRVSGREYNGLIESPCAASEDFGCTTCHRMHESEANVDGRPWVEGQPKVGARDGGTCGRCHAEIAAAPEAHAHHPTAATHCLDCHMPRTTYGLLGAIRSHTISSPSADATLTTRRPLACNLCHLDRSLSWAASMLERDFALPVPEELRQPCTNDDVEAGKPRCIPAGAEWLLAGDAGLRALAAWHFGWSRASAPTWSKTALEAVSRDDPYPAVRLVAERALGEGAPGVPLPAWAEAVRSRRDDRELRLAE